MGENAQAQVAGGGRDEEKTFISESYYKQGGRGRLVARSARFDSRGPREQGHAVGACPMTNQAERLPSGHNG